MNKAWSTQRYRSRHKHGKAHIKQIDLSISMLKGNQAHGCKHKHGIQAYPSPRRLDQHHQSIKTWQKVRRHARKAIKHDRNQDKSKIYYGKQISMLWTKIKQRVQIVAKNLHLHPLNLKSKILRPRRGKRVLEHYLLIVERREKSKVIDVFGREFREKKRENLPQKSSKQPNFLFFFFFI